MGEQQYLKDLMELYQGEVLGEVVFDSLMGSLQNDRERYVIGSMLQLETETKARLRPHLAQNDLRLGEDILFRNEALSLAAAMAKMSWTDKMQTLFTELDTKYVPRYQEMAANAPPAGRAVTASMVEHESALREAARREIAGETDRSVDPVAALLRYPLPKPPT